VTSDDRLIDELAQAVLDGDAVDWDAAESRDSRSSQRIGHLRTLAAIARVHTLQTWAHLRIVEPIGGGASGTVYRAWDTRLEREVALKLMPDAADAGDASSVIREGRLLARVQHPNVVTIHGADRVDGYVGLWMELVNGRTLEALLNGGAAFAPAEVMRIGLALGQALAAVHAAGLIHRDVKAHNVMRTDAGRIVLMDFGTGRELGDGRPDLTGTPLYLAPEVFQGRPATVQSDIYSLGVLLYRLLTRAYPVDGTTVEEVRRAHDTGARADLRRLRVPARFRQVLARALDPRPAARCRSAEDFCAEMEIALRAAARTRRLRRGAAAAAAMVIVLAGMWGSGWLSRLGTSPPVASIVSALGVPLPVLPGGERPVIAVRVFQNVTGDPEADPIVEGLAYEVVRSLSQLDGLELRSAMSSLTDAGRRGDPQAFGRSVGANLVLDGSVFGAAGRLRVSAQLVRVADNAVVLTVSIESATADPLALQETISRAIVNRLRLQGLGTRRYQLDPHRATQFLTARALQARRNTIHAGQAAELFAQIIAADEEFAPAHAGLASALGAFSLATPSVEAPPPDPRMRIAALRAIDLDPFLAEAHAAMGSLYARDRDWVTARASFAKAIDLEPTLTTAHSELVLTVLLPLGQLDEALRIMEDARRADPLSLDVRRVMALVQVESGLYDRAIESARWVLDRDPDFPFAELWLGRALLLSGRSAEAAPLLADKHWSYRGYMHAVTGRPDLAEEMAAAHGDDPAGQMLVYGGLGDADRAFAALERSVDLHWWRAAAWMHRPEVAILRGDPRMPALRRRMGLPRP
jgi:serine/threonine-protein kinase